MQRGGRAFNWGEGGGGRYSPLATPAQKSHQLKAPPKYYRNWRLTPWPQMSPGPKFCRCILRGPASVPQEALSPALSARLPLFSHAGVGVVRNGPLHPLPRAPSSSPNPPAPGMHWKGVPPCVTFRLVVAPPPPCMTPSLCPGNVPLMPSTSSNKICYRQYPPPTAAATSSNHLQPPA